MTDAGGMVVEATEYLPYGHERVPPSAEVSTYDFTDQELDTETGLYNYDARLYDPVIGRFISADSVIPDFYDPQSLNRYAYCRNNPLKYTDPDGNVPVLALVPGILGGVLGASSNLANNWGTLSPWKLTRSALVGAGCGFVSAYTGILGGVGMSVANDIHEQTLSGTPILDIDIQRTSSTAISALVTGKAVKPIKENFTKIPQIPLPGGGVYYPEKAIGIAAEVGGTIFGKPISETIDKKWDNVVEFWDDFWDTGYMLRTTWKSPRMKEMERNMTELQQGPKSNLMPSIIHYPERAKE